MSETPDWDGILQQVRTLVGRGKPLEAHAMLIGHFGEKPVTVAAICLRARLDAQINGIDAGLRFIENLPELEKNHPDIHLAQIELLFDAGRFDEACEKAVQAGKMFPGEIQFAISLVDGLELRNRPVEAAAVLEPLLAGDPNNQELLDRQARLAELVKRRLRTEAGVREVRDEVNRPKPAISLEGGFIQAFIGQFGGREDVYAIQVPIKSGQWGYRPVRGELEAASMKKHLAGDTTLGTYLVRRDNTSKLMVFDLDVENRFVKRLEHDPLERRRLMSIVRAEGERLLGHASAIGLPLLLEYSGYKGIHLWALGKEPFPARQLRGLGTWLLDQLDRTPPELHWELFPKQDSVAPDGFGNLVKIPLGLHQKTKKRSWFLDPKTFQPFPDQTEAFFSHPLVTLELFRDLLGKITLSQAVDGSDNKKVYENGIKPVHSAASPGYEEKAARLDSEVSVEVRIPLPRQFPPQIEKLFSGCGMIWSLVSRSMEKESLSVHEKHVLIYLLAVTGDEGRLALHQILNQAPGYDPDAVNSAIHAVPPNAMSCAKVRKTLPLMAKEVGCKCQFRLPEGCYSSPVVYAGVMPSMGSPQTLAQNSPPPVPLARAEIIAGASGGIDRLMREYAGVRSEIERLMQRARLLRHRVNTLFEDAGTDCLKTDIGEYRRIPPDDIPGIPETSAVAKIPLTSPISK